MFYLYRFINKDNEVIYVGKSGNIDERLLYHFGSRGHLPKMCYDETVKIEILKLKTKTEMNIKELYYISKFNAKYNSANKDECVFFKELEENDIWENYDLKAKKKELDKYKIIKLENEVDKLKKEIKDNKIKYLEELKKFTEMFHEYYKMKEVLEKYQEFTGLKWKRKGHKIVLYEDGK